MNSLHSVRESETVKGTTQAREEGTKRTSGDSFWRILGRQRNDQRETETVRECGGQASGKGKDRGGAFVSHCCSAARQSLSLSDLECCWNLAPLPIPPSRRSQSLRSAGNCFSGTEVHFWVLAIVVDLLLSRISLTLIWSERRWAWARFHFCSRSWCSIVKLVSITSRSLSTGIASSLTPSPFPVKPFPTNCPLHSHFCFWLTVVIPRFELYEMKIPKPCSCMSEEQAGRCRVRSRPESSWTPLPPREGQIWVTCSRYTILRELVFLFLLSQYDKSVSRIYYWFLWLTAWTELGFSVTFVWPRRARSLTALLILPGKQKGNKATRNPLICSQYSVEISLWKGSACAKLNLIILLLNAILWSF